MKKDKGPAFAFDGTSFINDRDGNIGEVYQEGKSFLVRLTATNLTDEDKKLQLAKRMQSWYYNTQVQKQ